MKTVLLVVTIITLLAIPAVAQSVVPVAPMPVLNIVYITGVDTLTLINTSAQTLTLSVHIAEGTAVYVSAPGPTVQAAVVLGPHETKTVTDFRTVWLVPANTIWVGIQSQ